MVTNLLIHPAQHTVGDICRIRNMINISLSFPSGSAVNNPPAMQEMPVQSLGWEDPLEKEMATHSIILAWETLWPEEPGGL